MSRLWFLIKLWSNMRTVYFYVCAGKSKCVQLNIRINNYDWYMYSKADTPSCNACVCCTCHIHWPSNNHNLHQTSLSNNGLSQQPWAWNAKIYTNVGWSLKPWQDHDRLQNCETPSPCLLKWHTCMHWTTRHPVSSQREKFDSLLCLDVFKASDGCKLMLYMPIKRSVLLRLSIRATVRF